MLAISPLRGASCEGIQVAPELDGIFLPPSKLNGQDFSDELLEDVYFDDLFVGFDDVDLLHDLEVDPAQIIAEFSRFEQAIGAISTDHVQEKQPPEADKSEEKGFDGREEAAVTAPASSSSSSDAADRARKPLTKRSQGKRKVKVDWTPELHRRFVQAVEQLGVEKAVPSRIVEIMGIDCLTRHNVKYRSHRKHLLEKEAEAASWTQRRQMYAGGGGGAATKREMGPTWLAPTIGFPHTQMPHFRPLHVWGHPTVDHPLVHVWPKQLVQSSPPPWVRPPPPPADASYWKHLYPMVARDGWVPTALTQGTPCFPQPLPAARFQTPPVPVVHPHPLYRPNCAFPPSSKPSIPHLQLDVHPSKERIDAAIGDVLGKTWLPLPLGLKPPSTESVLVELQRQGISKIPPTCGLSIVQSIYQPNSST